MSAYKLIKVVKTTEKETQSIYDKSDLKSALDDMHNEFGAAVKSDTTMATYCIVINNNTGDLEGNLYWEDETLSIEEREIRDRIYTHNDCENDNIAAYESEKLLIGNFHTKWAAYSKKEACKFAIVVKLNRMGNVTECLIKNTQNTQ